MSDRRENRKASDTDATGGMAPQQPTPAQSAVYQHLDTDALSAYLDDRLDGDLRVAAEGHIATCADCRRELAELRATVALLHDLPQFRPRRSFALGPEFAHPVRTSRLARLLPLLPTMRAAAAACLLLLVIVGAGDVLTQIGDESNDDNAPASVQEDPGDTAAFRGADVQAAGDSQQPDESGGAAVPSGDGTGGQIVGNSNEETEPDDVLAAAGQSDSTSDENSSADENSASAVQLPAAPVLADQAAGDSAAANADETLGESAGDADVAADSDTETGQSSSSSGAADSAAPASDTSASESASGDAFSSASESQSTVADVVPTIGISIEPNESDTSGTIAQANTSGAANDAQSSKALSERGISNWRLIEVILGVLVVVLGGLAIFLHRLRNRARRTGFLR